MPDFFTELDTLLDESAEKLRLIKAGKKPKEVKRESREFPAEEKGIFENAVTEKEKKIKKFELLPVRVQGFDELLSDRGLERGSTTLISGGTGTGKTTFCIQSLYWGARNGEKGVFISFEEPPEKIKQHMLKNYGWDLDALEKKGLIALIKLDPALIARKVEEILVKKTGALRIEVRKIELPIKPDKIILDSLSALSIAFENEENYRKYLRELFELLEEFDSVNFVITETEQNPKIYSRTGVEEFLADGLVVLYNLKEKGKRKKALEILKMRSGKHVQEMVPYEMNKNGIKVIPPEKDK